jgi:hypothetical protein
MLQIAMPNLQQYLDVGIVEEIAAFSHRMGFKVSHLNSSINYTANLNPMTAELLEKPQELDTQLYELAKKLSLYHAARARNRHVWALGREQMKRRKGTDDANRNMETECVDNHCRDQ